MKFKTQELGKALNIASHAIGKNAVLSSVENYLIQKSNSILTVTCTDLENTIECSYDVGGKKDIEFLLEPMAIKSFKNKKEVDFVIDDKSKTLSLKFDDDSVLKLELQNVGDFPAL